LRGSGVPLDASYCALDDFDDLSGPHPYPTPCSSSSLSRPAGQLPDSDVVESSCQSLQVRRDWR
jgi:hypothetical protein